MFSLDIALYFILLLLAQGPQPIAQGAYWEYVTDHRGKVRVECVAAAPGGSEPTLDVLYYELVAQRSGGFVQDRPVRIQLSLRSQEGRAFCHWHSLGGPPEYRVAVDRWVDLPTTRVGEVWTGPQGSEVRVTEVGAPAALRAPAGQFTNCRHVRLGDGSSMWVQPGVGVVKAERGGLWSEGLVLSSLSAGDRSAPSTGWVSPPVTVKVGAQSFKLGRMWDGPNAYLAATTADGRVVRDPATLERIFRIEYVYRLTLTEENRSLRIEPLDDEIAALQTMLNMSYAADAALFLRDISARALAEVIAAGMTGGASTGKAIAKTAAVAWAKAFLKDPASYAKSVNYLTMQSGLAALQRARERVADDVRQGSFTYERALAIEADLVLGLSRSRPSQLLQAQLYLQQGGGGDLASQLQQIAKSMGDQLLSDISRTYEYRNLLQAGLLGVKVADFLVNNCPAYARYVQGVQAGEKELRYETSSYYREVVKPAVAHWSHLPAPAAQSPPPGGQAGDVWGSPVDRKDMVFVPAGEFLMGSLDGDRWASADESPQRKVYLDAYWIDKCEVTVAQYRGFCDATGSRMPAAPSWGWHDDHAMVNVTWHDAVAYARWARKRLPIEAEWEKAARGTDGREYPWGNQWDGSKLVRETNRQGANQPVGSRPSGASPYGCLDMAGNVWEWCGDWYGREYYKTAPARNPRGPDSGEDRVHRGGSWLGDAPDHFRIAQRLHISPTARRRIGGFRCVRDAVQ